MLKKNHKTRKGINSHYQEIREKLKSEIASGKYPVGTLFPTDKQLTERFDLGRHTIREALRGLQELGLLSRRAGSGTFVLALTPPSRYTYGIDSLTQLDQYAAGTYFDKSNEEIVILRQSLADSLGRKVGEKWLRFAGIRRLNDDKQPLCWTEIFVASPYFDICNQTLKDHNPIFICIGHQFNIDILSVSQQVKAISMPEEIASILGIKAHAPAMQVRRTFYSEGPEPFEISLSLHPADRYVLTTDLIRENPTLNVL